jgi:hypothetical protein
MRSRPPTLFVASLALAALAGSSCREPDGELVSQRVENRDFVQPGQAFPPQIDEILIADWPPMGPAGVITVEVRDDAGVASVLFEFAETVLFDTQDQRNVTLDVLGIELGEGLGDMVVTATDVDGTWARRTVEGLLVDLSAPEIDLLDTYIPASGPEAVLFAWVSDAWILGDVTLEVGGEVLTYDFPDAYPSTLGQEWDYSLVSFEAGDLPLGSHLALLTVRDAAGNETSQSFDLVVDGTPPVASVAAPSDGEHVSGVFAVRGFGRRRSGAREPRGEPGRRARRHRARSERARHHRRERFSPRPHRALGRGGRPGRQPQRAGHREPGDRPARVKTRASPRTKATPEPSVVLWGATG